MNAYQLARQRQRITIEQATLILAMSQADYEAAEAGQLAFTEQQSKKLAVFCGSSPKKK